MYKRQDIFFVIAAGNIATSTPQPDNDQTAVYPSQLTKDLEDVYKRQVLRLKYQVTKLLNLSTSMQMML